MDQIPVKKSNPSVSEITLSPPRFTTESKENADRVVLLPRPEPASGRGWGSREFGGVRMRVLAVAVLIALAGGAVAGMLTAFAERRHQDMNPAAVSAKIDISEEPAPSPQPTVEVREQGRARPAAVSPSHRFSEPETPEARSLKVITNMQRYLDRVAPEPRKVGVLPSGYDQKRERRDGNDEP